MAHFDEHCADCERLFGDRCEDVNMWIDFYFREFGPRHRFKRHHWDGVREAEKLFGGRGRAAAIAHILKDCGHIPEFKHYANLEVDMLGIKRNAIFNGYWDAQQFTEAAKAALAKDKEEVSGD